MPSLSFSPLAVPSGVIRVAETWHSSIEADV